MERKLLPVELVAIVILFCLILSGCSESATSVMQKVEAKADIPTEIWEAFSERKIEPGAYYFNPEYIGGEVGYLFICGDEALASGYDIEVVKADFLKGNSQGSKLLDGEYEIQVVESAASDVPDYSKGSEYPFICFTLAKESAFDTIWKIESEGELIPINYWWGKDALSGNTGFFSYEIVQKQEDIPNNIWAVIETLDLQKGIFSFEQSDYVSEAYYALLVGGEGYEEDFNVAVESVRYDRVSGSGHDVDALAVFRLRQYSDRGTLPYADGFDRPFVILKLEPKENTAVRLQGGFDQFIGLYDDHIVYSDLVTNRSMMPR